MGRTAHTKCGLYLLASLLAAALLNGLFEQPAGSAGAARDFRQPVFLGSIIVFQRPARGGRKRGGERQTDQANGHGAADDGAQTDRTFIAGLLSPSYSTTITPFMS